MNTKVILILLTNVLLGASLLTTASLCLAATASTSATCGSITENYTDTSTLAVSVSNCATTDGGANVEATSSVPNGSINIWGNVNSSIPGTTQLSATSALEGFVTVIKGPDSGFIAVVPDVMFGVSSTCSGSGACAATSSLSYSLSVDGQYLRNAGPMVISPSTPIIDYTQGPETPGLVPFIKGTPVDIQVVIAANIQSEIAPNETRTIDLSFEHFLQEFSVLDSNRAVVSDADFTTDMGTSMAQLVETPEPSTLYIIGGALIGVAALKRR